MQSPCRNRKNSGQVLIVTSLVVILLLMSTVICVTEIQKNNPIYYEDANRDLITIKQAAANTIISALANISNGGNSSVILSDLNRLKSVVLNNSYNSLIDLGFFPSDMAPYSDGVWVSWGSAGVGVSSVSVNFVMNASGISSNYYNEYVINRTSSIEIEGLNTVNATTRTITVSCTVFNEDVPALAENLTIYYQQDSPAIWVKLSSPNTINYGNGTYTTTFTVAKQLTANLLPISIGCQDVRGITVWANATCPQQ
jgi:hypothetical protein